MPHARFVPAVYAPRRFVPAHATTVKRAPASSDDSPIALRLDTEYAQFVLGPRKGVWTAVRVFSRLFDGIFPNYDELMPREYSRGVLC